MASSKSIVLFLFGLVCFLFQLQSGISFASTAQTPQQLPEQAEEKNSPSKNLIEGEITCADEAVAGASIYLFRNGLIGESVTNEKGKFQVDLDSSESAKILVVADGKLFQIRSIDPQKFLKIEIRLAKQPTPLTGRIIDNQGMNVAGAELRLERLHQNRNVIVIPAGLDNELLSASTDENGTFQFAGIKRSMVDSISVRGKGIVTTSITGESFDSEIVLVAQPARVIKGNVTDRVSKAPLSDVVVTQVNTGSTAEVNDSGEFEMQGVPVFQPLLLSVNPTGEQPYLGNTTDIPAAPGFDSGHVEITLEPGVWVKCSVKDFGSGGPAMAEMFYFPTPENENFPSFVESFMTRGAVPSSFTNSSGDAQIVAIAGPGAIAIVADGFPPNESVNKLTGEQRAMFSQVTGRRGLTAIEWIEPGDLNDGIELSILVSKGRAIAVELADDQLDSTDNLIVHRAASKTSFAQLVRAPKFVAEQFQPGETRQILIHAPQKELGAILNVKAESDSPVQFVLKPTGGVSGRVVNKDAQPQTGLLIKFEIQTEEGFQEISTQVFTDANGRFEKPSLVADLQYRIAAIRLSKNKQAMMMSDVAPEMDSQWVVAEELKINSGEAVNFGEVVLGATDQPDPKRFPKKRNPKTQTPKTQNHVGDTVVKSSGDSMPKNNVLPSRINGVVTNEAGQPVANAAISFNTWPNRSGDLQKDWELTPTVLAQARSDANGNFQMSLDDGLLKKIIASKTDDQAALDGRKLNAAIVVVAEEMGANQIRLNEIADPKNLKVRLVREMVVRGKVISDADSKLTIGSPMRVYDVESINQIVTDMQEGVSFEKASQEVRPVSTLDPLAGGIPLIWKTSSSGTFLVRNIPLNSIFELHAITSSGQQKTIIVISRPMRGFNFKPSDESPDTTLLQGSRIKLDLSKQ